MKKRILTAALLALVAAGSAQAALLSDLFGGGSITAGDKLFDSFYLVTTGPQGALPASSDNRSFDASKINVAPLTDNGSGYGIEFSVTDNQFSVTGNDILAFADYSFGFRVRATDPSQRVVGASLEFDPGFAALTWLPDGFNDLGVYIKEAIGSARGGSDISSALEINFDALDDVVTRDFPNDVSFGPVSELWVTKNILVWSQDTTDTATLQGFSQRFTQANVPEPASYALVSVALLAAGAAGRRRKAAAG